MVKFLKYNEIHNLRSLFLYLGIIFLLIFFSSRYGFLQGVGAVAFFAPAPLIQ
jgi:hypothetical protein